MSINCPSPQALCDLLELFIGFFIFPEKELYEEINQGNIDLLIKELSQKAGLPIKSEFQAIPLNYAGWIDSYNRCFLGVEKPFAPPVESVYKVWTQDESFQLPFKNQKGYLMGDSAQHIQHILDYFGLVVPAEYSLMPDHLIILLELLIFLLDNNLEKEAKQLCIDHFDWLPDLQMAIANLATDGEIYIYALEILGKIIKGFVNNPSYTDSRSVQD
ncbi:MAG: molecular chaperone TorD family protein [Syntrophomonadaceae bacterium]|nr:molecular chaperone TorD family protein [Syntrophomonadaceae bacterium]